MVYENAGHQIKYLKEQLGFEFAIAKRRRKAHFAAVAQKSGMGAGTINATSQDRRWTNALRQRAEHEVLRASAADWRSLVIDHRTRVRCI
jgi:predicted xylose isomerase-like sugar epimerase